MSEHAGDLTARWSGFPFNNDLGLVDWQQCAVESWVTGDDLGPYRGTIEVFTGDIRSWWTSRSLGRKGTFRVWLSAPVHWRSTSGSVRSHLRLVTRHRTTLARPLAWWCLHPAHSDSVLLGARWVCISRYKARRTTTSPFLLGSRTQVASACRSKFTEGWISHAAW